MTKASQAYAEVLRTIAEQESNGKEVTWPTRPLPPHIVKSAIAARTANSLASQSGPFDVSDLYQPCPCIPTGWGALYQVKRTTADVQVKWKLALYVEQAALCPERADAYQAATLVRLADRKVGMPTRCILKSGGLLKANGIDMAGFVTGPDLTIAFSNYDAVAEFADWLKAGYLDYIVRQVCAVVARDPELAYKESRTFRPHHIDAWHADVRYLDDFTPNHLGLGVGA